MPVTLAKTVLVADGDELIPYTIHGNEKKVVLRALVELKFHDTVLDAKPISCAKTSWINYNFENERGTYLADGLEQNLANEGQLLRPFKVL